MQPCRSPYCECDVGECTHPGFYDARHEPTPTHAELMALWNVCKKFVKDQEISCAETIHQCDWVIEHAYEFIEDVCNVVGYQPYEDE